MSQNILYDSKPLRELIADRIRADIIKGTFNEGERLVEPKLAETLGISRTPIREALRQLEGEGFIEIVPRRGAVVKQITIKDLDDLYAIKANLEGLAASLAVGNMTSKEIEKLKRINEKFYDIAKGNKSAVDEYLSYNVDFHNVFINFSKNHKLIEILDSLSKNFQRFKGILVAKADRSADAYQQHLKIIEAFESGNSELAELTVREHIISSWEYLRKSIDKKGENL